MEEKIWRKRRKEERKREKDEDPIVLPLISSAPTVEVRRAES